jgi:hypothetical protein
MRFQSLIYAVLNDYRSQITDTARITQVQVTQYQTYAILKSTNN